MINHNDISYEMRYNQTPQADGFFVCEMIVRFNKKPISGKYYMNKFRKLKTGEKAEELDSPVNLIIKTKCPTKWVIEDLETGQRYRANGNTEVGKMFTPI